MSNLNDKLLGQFVMCSVKHDGAMGTGRGRVIAPHDDGSLDLEIEAPYTVLANGQRLISPPELIEHVQPRKLDDRSMHKSHPNNPPAWRADLECWWTL